jgi:hypothetical protein
VRVDLLTVSTRPTSTAPAVHVEYLARDLRRLADVRVHCFGAPRDEPGVTAYADPGAASRCQRRPAHDRIDLAMAAGTAGTDLVHSHTWYANSPVTAASLLHGVPHVVTTHSLEPLRRGRPSSSAAATPLLMGQSARSSRPRGRGVSAGMTRDVRRGLPRVDPDRVSGGAQRHRHRATRLMPYAVFERWHRPGPAQRRLRRSHHAAEGPAVPAPRAPTSTPQLSSSLRRRAGHPEIAPRSRRCRRAPAPSAAASCGSRRCSRSTSRAILTHATSSSARRSTSPWAS